MSQNTIVPARSVRYSRSHRLRPAFYLPLVLFSVSIVGGLSVLAAQLPTPTL